MFIRNNAVMSILSALVVLSMAAGVSTAHAEGTMKPGKVFKGKKAKPSLPQGYVSQGGLTWMPVTFTKPWAEANSYCVNTTLNGQTSWRLPTKDELSALYASGAMKGQGWMLTYNWSSSPGSSGSHYNVYLDIGSVLPINDTENRYVTCVR